MEATSTVREKRARGSRGAGIATRDHRFDARNARFFVEFAV
jgi:hypothetical protein